MTLHQQRGIGPKALVLTGTVLAGVTLGACTPGVPASTSQTTQPNSPAQAAQPSTSAAHSSTESSQTRQSSTASANSSDVDRGHTSMLSADVRQNGVAAGQVYATLTLGNTSHQTCTLYGYAGLQLIGPDGQTVPTKVDRDQSDEQPQLQRIAPGDEVTATLHWTYVPDDVESRAIQYGPCELAAVSVLVTPPDERDPASTQWNLGAVCQHGDIQITPFTK